MLSPILLTKVKQARLTLGAGEALRHVNLQGTILARNELLVTLGHVRVLLPHNVDSDGLAVLLQEGDRVTTGKRSKQGDRVTTGKRSKQRNERYRACAKTTR